jgi:hypothetical protein
MNEAWVPHSSLSHPSNYYHCYATLRCCCPSNTPSRLIGRHVKLEEWTFVSPSDWCSGGWPTHLSLANLRCQWLVMNEGRKRFCDRATPIVGWLCKSLWYSVQQVPLSLFFVTQLSPPITKGGTKQIAQHLKPQQQHPRANGCAKKHATWILWNQRGGVRRLLFVSKIQKKYLVHFNLGNMYCIIRFPYVVPRT